MDNKILVETSARHVHLTTEDMMTLLGKEITVKKMLSQPGQFASNERITLVGPKNSINNVLILGPVRKATQVELSLTDARTLGITDRGVLEVGKVADITVFGKRHIQCIRSV